MIKATTKMQSAHAVSGIAVCVTPTSPLLVAALVITIAWVLS